MITSLLIHDASSQAGLGCVKEKRALGELSIVPNPSTTRKTPPSRNHGSDRTQGTSFLWQKDCSDLGSRNLSRHMDESVCHTPSMTGMWEGMFSHSVCSGVSGRA